MLIISERELSKGQPPFIIVVCNCNSVTLMLPVAITLLLSEGSIFASELEDAPLAIAVVSVNMMLPKSYATTL
jgi:hypothetical protein